MGRVFLSGGRVGMTDPGSGLPSGYTALNYIQSSGTQYINTELSAPKGFHAVFDIELLSAASTQAIIGAHDTAAPYNRSYLAINSNKTWQIGYYDFYNFGSLALNTKYNIDVSTISGSIFCKINGTAQSLSTPTSAARSSVPIYVFAMNYGTNPLPCSAKLYGMKIYTSGDTSELARDLVPCISDTGGVGMYDLVTKKFYGNAGSGSFVGSEV